MKKGKFKNFRKEILHNKGAFFSLVFLILIIFTSILIGFYDGDPDAINISNMLAKPSAQHWFGTDELGRDYLIRIIYGGRVSLTVGVLAMLTSIIIGTTAGISAGYFGGNIDSFIMRLSDIFSAVPWIIMVTVVSLLIKKGIFSIVCKGGNPYFETKGLYTVCRFHWNKPLGNNAEPYCSISFTNYNYRSDYGSCRCNYDRKRHELFRNRSSGTYGKLGKPFAECSG
jgi:hypothetical protein